MRRDKRELQRPVGPRLAWLQLLTRASKGTSLQGHALPDVEGFRAVVWRATLPGRLGAVGWECGGSAEVAGRDGVLA